MKNRTIGKGNLFLLPFIVLFSRIGVWRITIHNNAYAFAITIIIVIIIFTHMIYYLVLSQMYKALCEVLSLNLSVSIFVFFIFELLKKKKN